VYMFYLCALRMNLSYYIIHMKSMESFEDAQPQETGTTQSLEIIDIAKEIQESVDSFMKKEHKPEDAYDIKVEHERLSDLIFNTRCQLEDQFGDDYQLAQELKVLKRELYRWTNALLAGFAEAELTKQFADVPESTLEQVKENSNYQGNMSLLLFDRVQSPDISAQLKNLLLIDRKYDIHQEEFFDLERISSELDEDLKTVSNDTPVTFTGKMPSANLGKGVRENMDPFFCDPITGDVSSVLQNSYVEAHEKGHYIRRLKSTGVANYFVKTIDLNKLSISQKYFETIKEGSIKEYGDKVKDMTHADVIEILTTYLKQPVEILERMSQLKNYYGFKGGEVFTKQHLEYAREHYVEDTQEDNYMGFFFDCITPETEERFLQVMNNSGV
jgi:hypothetical protein